MAELRDEVGPEAVVRLGAELARAWPAFPRRRWEAEASAGLGPLRLSERIDHMARVLEACLPAVPEAFAEVVRGLLASESFRSWIALPVCSAVTLRGRDDPDWALPLLAALTDRFSSEFAVRHFVEAHPEVTFAHLERWRDDVSADVRRLVSEGTRPRLPWAPRIRALVDEPSRGLALIAPLRDDPSEYVRRSVANHLNDVSHDHPGVALATATAWAGPPDVLRRGLRTLVRSGDPAALALLGYAADPPVRLAEITCAPLRVSVGETVVLSAVLEADEPTPAIVEYAIHHHGARAPRAPRPFRISAGTLPAGRTDITRRHRFAELSTRRIHPGPHRLEIWVNGRALGGLEVMVVDAARA